jgi:DNA-binding transcriptional MerR regulator
MLTIGDFARLGQVSPRMLRHYDEIGLLRPARVESSTGYRFYAVGQLARLHRLVALRDLGFSLEQIGNILAEAVSLDQLRGMLRMRQAQVEQTLVDEHARLRRIEAHLRALEGSVNMAAVDVVVKSTDPLRVAEAVGTAAGFGPDLGDIFERLYPQVGTHLARAGVRPGIGVAWYEEPAEDGSVVVHAGFAIEDRAISSGDGVQVVDLPVIQVASVVHRGSMDNVVPAYESLVRWVEDSGYHLAGRSRELYLEWHDDDLDKNVTELQMPIAK